MARRFAPSAASRTRSARKIFAVNLGAIGQFETRASIDLAKLREAGLCRARPST